MSTVKQLCRCCASGLNDIEPKLPKAVVMKLSLAVGAMIEAQTPNTVELTHLLPLDLERQDLREQWLRRLLKSKAYGCDPVMAPFAVESLRYARRNDQMILLSLDQTDLGNRMAVLMLTVRIGDRSLPLAWLAQAGAANLGFAQQKALLERVLPWLPQDAKVMLLADRFYPSAGLFQWLQQRQCSYRLRLKGTRRWIPAWALRRPQANWPRAKRNAISRKCGYLAKARCSLLLGSSMSPAMTSPGSRSESVV